MGHSVMIRYHDAQMDYYGRLYELTPALKEQGITFDQFMAMPARYLEAAFRREALTNIYRANPCIEARGILLETFLAHPAAILNFIFSADRGRRLVLDCEAIEQDLMDGTDCRLAGGVYQEPLHHHSYAHSRERTIVRR